VIVVVVYIDVLIIVSFYINYLLLRASAVIIHKPVKRGRLVAGALLGSLSALIIFLPEMGNATILIVRVISAVIMVAISYDTAGFRDLYKTSLLFFFVSFIFAGVEYAVASMLGGSSALWHNSVLYLDISLLTLVISTVISYAVLWLLRRHFDSTNAADGKYTVTVENSGVIASFAAISDTGNNLVDSFSGKPVIIVPIERLSELVDQTTVRRMINCDYIHESVIPPKGWRLIPFSTVNSNGLLPAFCPGKIYLRSEDDKKTRLIDAYIGVSEADMDYAVFNPKLLTA
jgi:stage II sporulation protein GA (sporulation sigma-E factor processing peptidase)